MYFPLGKLHEWGKRPGVQPQVMDSEIPKYALHPFEKERQQEVS